VCELLALNFNVPIKANLSFRGFKKRGKYNPEGWGIAYYPDESAQIFKEPLSAEKSELSNFLKD